MKVGKILQIGHHLRYHPLYYFAKDHYIDRGLLGEKITNIHIQWNRNGDWRRQPMKGTFDFKKWGFDEPDHLFNWRLYRKYSGGVMTELASHQLDVVNWFLGDAPPTRVMGVGKIDYKDGRTIFDNCHLTYEYPNDVQATCECICTNSYSPFSMQPYEMFQGGRATLVMAHLSHYVGLYFLEPGAKEELWMPMATKIDVGFENIVKDNHKRPIVLNGTPSPGSKTEMVGSLPLEGLVDVEKAQILRPTYEIELINFKMSCLDNTRPACDGLVGLKSAIPALRGYEAMEKGQPIEISKSDYSLA
jgi:predicted dehydrogenase